SEIDNFIKEIKVKEEERVSYMTYEMKIREAHDDGRAEGFAQGKREMILSMIKNGLDDKTISNIAALPIETIQQERRKLS
ncbi:MAG: hypothetical protein IIY91_04315, partial [Selenomonas sp.]|nr:hypothetical protein [Selenomonas sp.]